LLEKVPLVFSLGLLRFAGPGQAVQPGGATSVSRLIDFANFFAAAEIRVQFCCDSGEGIRATRDRSPRDGAQVSVGAGQGIAAVVAAVFIFASATAVYLVFRRNGAVSLFSHVHLDQGGMT
jgi:hypothetical protein